ncbi:LOW QUALITY PROTEIN: hypothetical protein PanWU01x14_242100, partial [Parasponia andersonii]
KLLNLFRKAKATPSPKGKGKKQQKKVISGLHKKAKTDGKPKEKYFHCGTKEH